jgi:hypothetical protein
MCRTFVSRTGAAMEAYFNIRPHQYQLSDRYDHHHYAYELMAELHNRMPVILDPECFDWWMTGPKDEVEQLLVPCPSEELEAYPISRQVNNPRNEGLVLLRPAA